MNAHTSSPQLQVLRERFENGDLAEKRVVARELRNLCGHAASDDQRVITALLKMSEYEDAEVATNLMAAISQCGSAGRAALREIVNGAPGRLRAPAAFALGLTRHVPLDVIDALALLLDSADHEERTEAMRALGNIGYYGRQPELLQRHLSRITAGLDDPDEDVREAAAHALRGAGLPDDQLLTLALQLMNPASGEPNFCLRNVFLQLLDERDPLPYLSTLLKMARYGGVGDMLDVLGRLGPAAGEAVPLLEPMFAEHTYEALKAGAAIYRITGRTDVLARMHGQLREAPDEIASVISSMGPGAAPILPELAEVLAENLDCGDWDLPGILVDALVALESEEAQAVASLTSALSHSSASIRYKALVGLRRAGPAAREAMTRVRELTHDDDREIAELARATLRAIETPPH